MIREYFKHLFKKKQVEALQHMQTENLIVIAKIEFNKSFLFQTALLLHISHQLILIIMLLITLKKKQYKKVNLLKDCQLIVLNNDNNNFITLIEIQEGNFTHDKILN